MNEHRSFWLQQALDEETKAGDALEAPPLEGDARANVLIVGGGYCGLWTAIDLKTAEPSLDVALIEADICGAGASGRNAGYLVDLRVKLPVLEAMCGSDDAVRIAKASVDAALEIEAVCRENGIDADFRRQGYLWGASCDAHGASWNGVIDALTPHQINPFEVWDRDTLRERTCFPSLVGGAYAPTMTVVQPAKLIRGLRALAIKRGVRVYEESPLQRLERKRPPVVHTPRGKITAERAVLAMNAWSLALPELRSAIVIVGADMGASAPMPERLAELGWTDGPAVVDSRLMSDFYRTTADGRIALGKGGGSLNLGYAVRPFFNQPSRRPHELFRIMGEINPALAGTEFVATWSGPIDRSRSGLPLFGRLVTCPDVFYGYGFSGNGIVPCRIGGKILSSLIRDLNDEWSKCGLVQPVEPSFPPEPVRYIGGSLVHAAVARKDALELRGKSAGRITRGLAALAPASFKPTD